MQLLIYYLQGVSEIGGQTLRAYFTYCKDKKKSYKYGFENASFLSYKHFVILYLYFISIFYFILISIFYTCIYFLFYTYIYIFITEIAGNDFFSHRRRMDCWKYSKILGVFCIFSFAIIIRFRNIFTIAIGVSYMRILRYPDN